VSSIGRIAGVAEAQARELSRRRVALLLLIGLPLAFYGALAGHAGHAVVAGTVATAFSISGAGIFAILAGRPIDQRLVLAGYRPAELVAGRLAFLTVLSLPILAGTSALMLTVSHPAHPAELVAAVALLGLDAVPLGLAIATLLPRELEATLVLIGIVGVQLSLEPTQTLSALLPLHAATGSPTPLSSSRSPQPWRRPPPPTPPQCSPSPSPRPPPDCAGTSQPRHCRPHRPEAGEVAASEDRARTPVEGGWQGASAGAGRSARTARARVSVCCCRMVRRCRTGWWSRTRARRAGSGSRGCRWRRRRPAGTPGRPPRAGWSREPRPGG
jgi:hypothetical protein